MNGLPRTDLREPAFRRYEPFLARAVLAEKATIGLSELLPMKMKAHTFAIRCKDAILAYNTFGYHSEVLPDPPVRFKVVELGEMEVEISFRPYLNTTNVSADLPVAPLALTTSFDALPFDPEVLRMLCYEVSLRERQGFSMLCVDGQEAVMKLMEEDYAVKVDIRNGCAKIRRI